MDYENTSLIYMALNYDRGLRKYAYSLTKDKDDADDLLQDTYLKVLQNEHSFEQKTNLQAWVYTIMRNTYVNDYKRKQRERMFVDKYPDLYHLSNYVSSPSDAADSCYHLKEINNTIEKTKEEKRIPFEMYLDGYKYKEIAQVMNLSIGTVKSRIFFTRKELMDKLKEYTSHA
jgi:RNA polymerase sigma-70 factor (ECF subfamily)